MLSFQFTEMSGAKDALLWIDSNPLSRKAHKLRRNPRNQILGVEGINVGGVALEKVNPRIPGRHIVYIKKSRSFLLGGPAG